MHTRLSQTFAALLLATPLLNSSAAFADPAETRTIYSDVTLIDGTGAPALPHQDIIISGERIIDIVPHAEAAAAADDASTTVIDLAGRYVIPGLIDSHVHMATPPEPDMARACCAVTFMAVSQPCGTWQTTFGSSANSPARRA